MRKYEWETRYEWYTFDYKLYPKMYFLRAYNPDPFGPLVLIDILIMLKRV